MITILSQESLFIFALLKNKSIITLQISFIFSPNRHDNIRHCGYDRTGSVLKQKTKQNFYSFFTDMKNTNKLIMALLGILIVVGWFVISSNHKTAGYYTTKIIQDKAQIIELTRNIAINKMKMCKLPNAESNWTCEGLVKETQSPQRTWTQTQVLSNLPIE